MHTHNQHPDLTEGSLMLQLQFQFPLCHWPSWWASEILSLRPGTRDFCKCK